MKIGYFADTDSPHINLPDESSVASREIPEGVVLNYGATGGLVGIEIDEASQGVQLDKWVLSRFPSAVETVAV